ncbi:HEAT repeat domain-containing protein [Corallococcus terminator]|uniref:HEAT repeat domain-containing protein n=1 Tax=Corallococcus terminator TaxID=2316733 RepID=A0A3A8IX18_9BACT|nr:HEAT repeat domain-containing protein [Corallococcus terminator]RKG87146.1 hypothetical protein D7V88_16580 [Corallococcus terminator]
MGRVPTVDEWVARLSARDAGARDEALEALEEALGSGEAESRERTARALIQELGRPGTTAISPILFLLQRGWWPPQASLTESAVQAVLSTLPRTEAGSADLEHAALVLTLVCRVDASQLSALEGAFAHPHPSVRSAMARVVGRLGKDALPALPRVLALLDDEESVAISALESLGSLAVLAPDVAAPRLLEQVRRTDGVRLYLALVSLRGLLEELLLEERAVPSLVDPEPALLRALEEPEPPIRQESVSLLGLLGPVSPVALAALRDRLRDESPSVAASAAVALLGLGAPSAEPLFLLKGQLGQAAPEVQEAALSALMSVDPARLRRAKGMLESVVGDTSGATRVTLDELLASLD